MKINIKKLFIFIGISIAILMIVMSFWDMHKKEKSITENKHETVGKVYKFYSNRSNNRYYYKYSYNSAVYNDNEDLDYYGGDECIGKFYKVYLSTKNPQYSKIILDHEITDTTEILNAGFTIEDLKE